MIKGFSFNGKHSYTDFGLCVESKSIQSPSKKKIKIDVPFMNGSYDFSTVGSNGEILYNQRSIIVSLGLPTRNKEQLYTLYSKVLEWIEDIDQNQLIFDDMLNYYFLAEVENGPSFEEFQRFGKITITFIAQPFKVGLYDEGSEMRWDTFSFEEDILQESVFEVIENKIVTINNGGRTIIPIVNCNSSIECILNGYNAKFLNGDNKDYKFRLLSGDNAISIKGNGTIKFIFRKESL